MSVVGIDLGNLNTVVAVARNRGIDVICNEVSNRATPSLVSFGERQRYLGESAKTQEISNFKSTVSTLKRLMGRPFSDPDVQNEARYTNAALVEGEGGQVAAKVMFKGEPTSFTFTQLAGMFLGKVKEFTSHELKSAMTDAVISCPAWFTDRQRRAVLDAAEVAGINCLRVMDDTTASALGYGITKTDLPEAGPDAKPRTVVFVDFGHSSFQVSVVSFVKGKLVIKGTAFDRNLGGRDFDDVLCQHFIDQFDKAYKLDIRSSSKAVFRLRQGCEKVKKILSANPLTMLNVECLLDDKDVSSEVRRADFEEWAKPLLDRVLPPIQNALAAAGIEAKDVDFVELVGGSTRIHAVKETIAAFFGAEKLSTTMNQDEAVARGCALQCAILSPVFKVRDFAVQSWNSYPIEFTWDVAQVPPAKSNTPPDTRMDVFPVGNAMPSTKGLTFARRYDEQELASKGALSFVVDARYHESARERGIPEGCGVAIGRWIIGGIQKLGGDKAEKGTIKVKARLDGNGILAIESAHQVEDVMVPVEKDAKETANGEGAKEEGALSADGKMRRVVKKHDLTITIETAATSKPTLESWFAAEGEMAANDRLIMDTAEKRNSLEEYVYETRSKLEMAWSEFITDADRTAFLKQLNETEEWLYTEEGEDATKSVYVEKLAALTKVGGPVASRYLEAEERPRHERLFREYVNSILLSLPEAGAAAVDASHRYAHLTPEELTKVREACTQKLTWLNDGIAKQNETDKCLPPVITVAQMSKEKELLGFTVNPILNRPKPKVEEAPAPAASPAPTAESDSADTVVEEAAAAAAAGNPEKEAAAAAASPADKGMELD